MLNRTFSYIFLKISRPHFFIAALNITIDLFEFLSEKDLESLICDMRQRCIFKKCVKGLKVITTQDTNTTPTVPMQTNSETIEDWVSY